ncbi:MAG: radical SAM/SPASM domain-containing protein [Phycisphaerae bacterium]
MLSERTLAFALLFNTGPGLYPMAVLVRAVWDVRSGLEAAALPAAPADNAVRNVLVDMLAATGLRKSDVARSPVHKKLQLFRAWSGGYPVWCSWQVNYRCNFWCNFCHYWRDPMGDAPEMTLEQFQNGAEKLSELGTLLVSLAGGEPLIRPDIVDIVRAVGRYHFTFLTTNGWFVTKELAEELFGAGLWGVSISLDYADPERHDRKRGRPGAFERALAAVERFGRARRYKWQRVNWLSVLLEDNLDQLEPMIEMAARRGAYFMVQPYCAQKTGSKRFVHKGASVSEYLLHLRRQHPNFLSNPYFLERFDQALNGGVRGCKAGRGFFNIDSTGDIAVCVEKRACPVANLFEHSAREIVGRLHAEGTPSRCTACWYNCRGEIESLYHPWGLIKSLPTYLFDRGRAPSGSRVGTAQAEACGSW